MRRTVIFLLPMFILAASCGGTELIGSSDDGSDASPSTSNADSTGSSCPSTIAAYCAQPGFQCSDTWAAASASNPSCTEGAYELVFFSESCDGYDLAGTLYWDAVQTYFIYDHSTGALVGITSTTGTESQGGIHVLCAVGVPFPSADASCAGGSSCL